MTTYTSEDAAPGDALRAALVKYRRLRVSQKVTSRAEAWSGLVTEVERAAALLDECDGEVERLRAELSLFVRDEVPAAPPEPPPLAAGQWRVDSDGDSRYIDRVVDGWVSTWGYDEAEDEWVPSGESVTTVASWPPCDPDPRWPEPAPTKPRRMAADGEGLHSVHSKDHDEGEFCEAHGCTPLDGEGE